MNIEFLENLKCSNLALCSTICGTETRLQDLFHILGRCSTNCGTVPLFVELFHKKWNCSTLCRSSWIQPKYLLPKNTEHSNIILMNDVNMTYSLIIIGLIQKSIFYFCFTFLMKCETIIFIISYLMHFQLIWYKFYCQIWSIK